MEKNFGGLNCEKQLNLYIQFIEYLCLKGKISLDEKQIMKLFENYIIHAICESHSDILFKILSKESKDAGMDKFIIMNDKIAKEFFDTVFCGENMPLKQLTELGFSCFTKFLHWSSDEKYGSPKAVLSAEPSRGLNSLWQIAFLTPKEKIRQKAKEYITDIIEQQCKKFKSKRIEILNNALSIALRNIKENEKIIITALSIINEIIERLECLKIEEISISYSVPPLCEINISGVFGENTVFINENLKISNLKSLISAQYKVHKSLIILRKFKDKEIVDDVFDFYISSLKNMTDNKLILDIKPLEIPYKETPRYILSNNLDLFNILLWILGNSHDQEIVNNVWKLIISLPINEQLKSRILNADSLLKINSEGNYDWFADVLRISKELNNTELLYNLYVLYEIHLGKNEKNTEFMDTFMEKSGLEFLRQIYENKKNCDLGNSNLDIKFLDYTIRILKIYINPDTFLEIIPDEKDSENLFTEILKFMRQISRIKKNTEFFNNSMISFFEACCHFHEIMLISDAKLIPKILTTEYFSTIKQCILVCFI